MNYLALTQRVHLLLRVGEETPGTQPTTVVAQTGLLSEMVQWVREAHYDICTLRTEWAFMRATGSFTLPAGSRTLSVAAMRATAPDLGKVVPFVSADLAFVGMTPAGVSGAAEVICQLVKYQHWVGQYDAAPIPTGQPRYCTLTPAGDLEFDAVPDRDYLIRTPYRKAVVPLANDGDLPMFDGDYDKALVWWAILNYYCPSRDNVVELRQKADKELTRELTKMFNEQLPDFTVY